MKKIALAMLVAVGLLSGCGKMDHSGMGNRDGMNHNEGHMNMAPIADASQAANVKALFQLVKDEPQRNQDTTITVDLQDKDGVPIEQFDVNHEKKMHMIIVSKDLSYFNHIHPDYNGKNEFTVKTQFPSAGQYEIIADFAPTGIGAMSKSQWITVEGKAPAAKPVEADASLTKIIDGKEITLSFDHLMANMELSLNFNIKDAKSKEPVANLQPYLGAVGHVVILNKEGGEYLHVHPVDEQSSGPDAKFMAAFPHSGVYKIWGQFQQNGKVFTVPFVVEVP